jgi:hypothetical protein
MFCLELFKGKILYKVDSILTLKLWNRSRCWFRSWIRRAVTKFDSDGGSGCQVAMAAMLSQTPRLLQRYGLLDLYLCMPWCRYTLDWKEKKAIWMQNVFVTSLAKKGSNIATRNKTWNKSPERMASVKGFFCYYIINAGGLDLHGKVSHSDGAEPRHNTQSSH